MPRKTFNRPSPHLPAVVQMKKLREILSEVERSAAKQRRLLWLAIQSAGGRLEIELADYRMAMQGPASDYSIALRVESVYDSKLSKDVMKAVLVFVDADGKIEERSEQKRIIEA